jgi:methylase of polypeptide subunit release factors
MEAHINQIETIRTLMLAHGYTNVRAYRDLTGRDRVVSGKKPYAESH